jgi:hypothetical protein
MILLSAAGEGNGPAVRRPQSATPSSEQFFTFFVWGTFGGATVTLEISPSGESSAPWFDTGLSVTEAGAVNVEFRAERVRAVVTGGSSPEINAMLL